VAKSFKKLTRPLIRQLKPGASINEHGISFARIENGDGVFSVNIMVDGQRIHRVIGKESERVTRTQAENFIAQVRTEARQNRLGLPKGRKTNLTFREASERYIHRLEASDGRDLESKQRKIRQHLVPFFGNLPLSEISGFQIERYKKSRQESRAMKSHDASGRSTYKDSSPAPATINRELAVLSHLFSKALEWGWIRQKPKIVRLKENRGRIVYLTVDQARELVECAKADNNVQIYPFIVIGLGTGMRMSEILSIRKEHVDLVRRVIFIPKAKAGAREQPTTVQLADYLEGYIDWRQEGDPWLFPSTASRTGHTVNINKPFRRVGGVSGA
jgi:integrase